MSALGLQAVVAFLFIVSLVAVTLVLDAALDGEKWAINLVSLLLVVLLLGLAWYGAGDFLSWLR